MPKTAGLSDLVKGDGGYYNPADLKPGSDTVEGWSTNLVDTVGKNQDWARQMGYDKGGGKKDKKR
jgi:hypothetical protein